MPDYTTWKRIFDQELLAYRAHHAKTGDYVGYFSVPKNLNAAKIGQLIKDTCPRAHCLDIGCGPLPRPVYMAKGMDFTGVDPDPGYTQRDFPFKQAMGEDLPFDDASFDCVTLMSSLDHALDPDKVLSEAYRVLRPDGYIFVWYSDKLKFDERDEHHLHYFHRTKICDMLTAHGFTSIQERYYPNDGICETMLAIARKSNA